MFLGVVFLGKAIIAFAVTLILGVFFGVIGHDFLNGFTVLGAIVAISTMGAFIIYFNEKLNSKE